MPDRNGARPTRRTLLALLGAAFVATPDSTPAATPASPPTGPDEPILHLWHSLDQALARRDAAQARRDRLEAALVRRLGYPRVRLPRPPGAPPRYAADPFTIDRTLGAGRRRRRCRLKSQLRRRQLAWHRAAHLSGLAQALRDEDAAIAAVEQATTALFAAPAMSVVAVRLKLAVLLATHTPGPAFVDAAPWAELRANLADLDHLRA